MTNDDKTSSDNPEDGEGMPKRVVSTIKLEDGSRIEVVRFGPPKELRAPAVMLGVMQARLDITERQRNYQTYRANEAEGRASELRLLLEQERLAQRWTENDLERACDEIERLRALAEERHLTIIELAAERDSYKLQAGGGEQCCDSDAVASEREHAPNTAPAPADGEHAS